MPPEYPFEKLELENSELGQYLRKCLDSNNLAYFNVFFPVYYESQNTEVLFAQVRFIDKNKEIFGEFQYFFWDIPEFLQVFKSLTLSQNYAP